MDKHNQDAQDTTDSQRDDQAGARALARLESENPEVTAMVIRVASIYMERKASSN